MDSERYARWAACRDIDVHLHTLGGGRVPARLLDLGYEHVLVEASEPVGPGRLVGVSVKTPEMPRAAVLTGTVELAGDANTVRVHHVDSSNLDLLPARVKSLYENRSNPRVHPSGASAWINDTPVDLVDVSATGAGARVWQGMRVVSGWAGEVELRLELPEPVTVRARVVHIRKLGKAVRVGLTFPHHGVVADCVTRELEEAVAA